MVACYVFYFYHAIHAVAGCVVTIKIITLMLCYDFIVVSIVISLACEKLGIRVFCYIINRCTFGTL